MTILIDIDGDRVLVYRQRETKGGRPTRAQVLDAIRRAGKAPGRRGKD